MSALLNYLPLLNALFCLGIGLFVLSRNCKISANIGFFVGMAALGLMEFAAYMGASTGHGVYTSLYDKMFGAGEILLPGSGFVFSLSFARVEASRSFERWRVVKGGRFLGLRLPGGLPDDHLGQPRSPPR